MDHETARELSAAHALGALDVADEGVLEAHLETCDACRDEFDRLLAAAASLAYAPDPPAPPPALRERVLAAARAERPNVVPLRPRTPRRAFTVGTAVTAATAAAAAVALAFYAADLSGDLERERSASAVLADPEARDVALAGAEGRLVVAPSGEAVLVADLAGAPSSRTYQLWIIEGDRPEPAGTFGAEEQHDVVRLTGRVPAGAVVAVTVEREGGVDAPTTEPVFTAQT
jgi:anti-sigma-K factor RskA